jgi:AraC-like DNA-binding protein
MSLDQLSTLFVDASLPLILKPEAGEGSLLVFNLEDGLKLRFWDCRLISEVELYNNSNKPNEWFHLAFFLHPPGLQIETDRTVQKNFIWDIVFFSSSSNLRIIIPPSKTVHCLSMSISKGWINRNLLRGNHHVRANLKKLISDRAFSMLDCMNVAEKKNVVELSAMATSDRAVSFYIKSTVLKIISDFFLKMTEDKVLDSIVASESPSIDEIEKYISDHISSLKTVQEITNRFSMSESRLKKLFKRKYGTSITDFLTKKRMELAKHYVDEHDKSLQEVARMLGYKNVHHFIASYKRYFKIE